MTNSEVKEYVDDIIQELDCYQCPMAEKCWECKEDNLCVILNDKVQEIIKENEELEKRNSELCIELVVTLNELSLLKTKK